MTVMKKIRLSLKERSHDILIGRGILRESGRLLRKLCAGDSAVIVSNRTVWNLYGKALTSSMRRAGLAAHVELVPDSEKAKSFDTLKRLLNKLCRHDKYKSVFIVAFGGGVIGDLAGFAAAVYKRGVPYIHIPTTLLAQVDSAVGGKVAVDLPAAKNLAGAFWQPRMVISDISLLESLSNRQMRNGLAEVIKYGVIKDSGLFGYLETNYRKALKRDRDALEFVIFRSASIKARIVERDERDTKLVRAILNYGHTIGHAIEAASGYSSKYNHGEAVAIGMAVAGRISSKLGLLSSADSKRIEGLTYRSGLPICIKGLSLAKVYEAYQHDKKFTHGMNRFILPTAIGSARVVSNIPADVIKNTVRECYEPL